MSCDTVALYKITIFVIYFLENTPQIWHKSSQGFIHNICTFQLALESYIQCSIVLWAGLPLVTTSLVMMLTKSYSGGVYSHGTLEQTPICAENFGKIPKGGYSRKEREPHYYFCKFSLFDISPSTVMSNPAIDKCWEYFLQKVKCIMQMCAAVCDRQTAPLNMVTHNMLGYQYAQNMLTK